MLHKMSNAHNVCADLSINLLVGLDILLDNNQGSIQLPMFSFRAYISYMIQESQGTYHQLKPVYLEVVQLKRDPAKAYAYIHR